VLGAWSDTLSRRAVLPSSEWTAHLMDYLEQARAGGLAGVSTGLRDLDTITLGLSPGLYLLAAATGTGKTAIAGQIALHVAEQHGSVVFVSKELTDVDLAVRLMSVITNVRKEQLVTGALGRIGAGLMELNDRKDSSDALCWSHLSTRGGSQSRCLSRASNLMAPTCRSGVCRRSTRAQRTHTASSCSATSRASAQPWRDGAFDPAGSADEVVSTIAAGVRSARALQPVLQMAVEGSLAISCARFRPRISTRKAIMKDGIAGALAKRGRSAIGIVVILCALSVTSSASLLAQEIDRNAGPRGRAVNVFYTTSTGPNGVELFAIEASDGNLGARDIGPMLGGDCSTLALSGSGTLYSVCGPLFGEQQLATVNLSTGRANLFGIKVPGLAVMAMAFAPNGTLYAIGDCNPDRNANFECTPGSDPNYNSLYKVNRETGAFTRIGATRAPQFFMDLTFDRHGTLFGVTTTLNPSTVPAILYRVDLATGKATKLVNLVGSNYVMGLAFGRDGRLYGTDYFQNPGLYVIDPKTGFETAVGALPFSFSSGLELGEPE
jgi:hypothetical protein